MDVTFSHCAGLDVHKQTVVACCLTPWPDRGERRRNPYLWLFRAGGTVLITWEARPDGRGRLSVTDTGRGLPLHTHAQLLQPFERLSAEASGVEGTGLGLALSQHLMSAMGGTLELATTRDAGSNFWLDLPLTARPVARATF